MSTRLGERLRRFTDSLQFRMVVIFLALIALSMLFISAYLLRTLENYSIDAYERRLSGTAETLARLAAPVLGSGAPEALDAILAQWQERGLEMAVVDRSGRVVSASSPAPSGAEVGTSLAAAPEVHEALAGRQVIRIHLDPQSGTRKVYVAWPVAQARGRQPLGAVYLTGSLGDVDATLGRVRAALMWASALAAAVAAFVSALLARPITGPIRELTAHARRLARGRFEERIRVRSRDEVGELAETFNRMAEQLAASIDELARQKEQAEAILSHMADGVVVLDRRGRTLLVNPAAEEALAGRSAADALREVLGEREGGGVREVALVELGSRQYEARLAVLRGPGGQPGGVVAVLHDVTERQRLDAMRKEFVANASHELKTPLTTIKSYVETLLDGAWRNAEVTPRFLAVVHDETERMIRLVNELLDLSQLEAGAPLGPAETVYPEDLLAAVRQRFLPVARSRGIALEVRDEGAPPVLANPDRLEQVLANLVENALNYTPGGGRVEVVASAAGGEGLPEEAFPPGETSRSGEAALPSAACGAAPPAASGARLRLTVRDTGAGIPEKDLPRVFERFYRVDKARSRKMGGTGLGLAIVREIVESYGGRVSIRSRVGAGTTVEVELPAGDRLPEGQGALR
ncbi:MAG: ATP-binding protein [Bacillota bacterium]|nr:ATP-binding protein [Bacillota bacterium]